MLVIMRISLYFTCRTQAMVMLEKLSKSILVSFRFKLYIHIIPTYTKGGVKHGKIQISMYVQTS